MEILAAYDLTRSYRAAAAVCGVSHNTVRAYVQAREEGRPAPAAARRGRKTDPYLDHMVRWVKDSRGRIRGDVVHEKLVALGYDGSIRTTRGVLAGLKEKYRLENTRVHRPWTPEPGRWLQYDYGDGPVVDGAKTVLFCAWLAFSRFRIVIPLLDKTLPSVFTALDRCFRILGGVPTYVLTDNEKTVTIEHVAGIPVRNPQMVAFARHYSTSVATCLPADPVSKGGVENAVRIAKADLVPTDANLLPGYASFSELEDACTAFMDEVNSRVHRATLEIPAEMLKVIERARLHPVPGTPMTAAFGQVRQVPSNTPMVTFDHARYSVPHTLMGSAVWVRRQGEEVVIVHTSDTGPVEVARHRVARPGVPAVIDAHFPPAPSGPLERKVRAVNPAEAEFLAIGSGAALWLKEAATAGTNKIRHKMERAVALAKMLGTAEVDKGLGIAAVHQRFTHEDLVSIVTNGTGHGHPSPAVPEDRWLSQGTGAWAAFGTTPDADAQPLEGAGDEH
ncbi:IS21 family transposase [Arthrobacter sp. I2-34]|uniref:IS21 family transposase n=2 Tax=Arthrobacter hankyongi TaxID=2904801 RepID=A0ABS9L7V7_9MICC|nr:IS21 family transposase [Arthrobacter hankyongi]